MEREIFRSLQISASVNFSSRNRGGAGVAREVLEETGIHVEVDELTGVYKNMARGVVALVFRCKPSGGTERTSTESTAVS